MGLKHGRSPSNVTNPELAVRGRDLEAQGFKGCLEAQEVPVGVWNQDRVGRSLYEVRKQNLQHRKQGTSKLEQEIRCPELDREASDFSLLGVGTAAA